MKEFSSLILDIKDMSEVDKLFNFMSGVTRMGSNIIEKARCPRLSLGNGSNRLPIQL